MTQFSYYRQNPRKHRRVRRVLPGLLQRAQVRKEGWGVRWGAEERERRRRGRRGGGGGRDGRVDGSKLNSCQHLSSVNVLSRVCQSAFSRITVPPLCLPERVCVCVPMCEVVREWARVYIQLARRETNTTGRRFPVSALRLRWLSVTQTRIIALIVKSARGVSERTALRWEGLERKKTRRRRRRNKPFWRQTVMQ